MNDIVNPYSKETEAAAFELGRQLGYIQAKLDSMEKSFDRMEHRLARPGLCSCKQCEERRQEVQG